MELHTLGVDGGYTQKDIIEVAKCFTGWTIADPRGYRRAAASMIQGTEDKRIEPAAAAARACRMTSTAANFISTRDGTRAVRKPLLGQTINEGGDQGRPQGPRHTGQQPGDRKVHRPKLAVKFVSDNPSDALVSRVADAFHKSGGDIKTTLKASVHR